MTDHTSYIQRLITSSLILTLISFVLFTQAGKNAFLIPYGKDNKRMFKESKVNKSNSNDDRFVPDFWRKRCTCTLGRGWSGWPPGTMAAGGFDYGGTIVPGSKSDVRPPSWKRLAIEYRAVLLACMHTYLHTYIANQLYAQSTHESREESRQATIEPSRWTVPNDLGLHTHAGPTNAMVERKRRTRASPSIDDNEC